MSRRDADNWSHLVDPYTWPWSLNGHGHGHEWPTATPFVQCQSVLPFWDTSISKFDHENPWSRSCVWSKVKVTFDLQNSKVKVMVKVKPIGHIWGPEFNQYVYFSFWWQSDHFWLRYRKFHIWPWKFQGHGQCQTWWSHLRSWGSIVCLLFISWQSDHFWLIYSKFYIWPWKFKVNVMAKVKPDGHIWALEFNRYVCFSFRGNRTIFGWDIANSILTLKNLGQGHDEDGPKSKIQKVVQKLSREQESAAGGGVRTGTKTSSSSAVAFRQRYYPAWCNTQRVVFSFGFIPIEFAQGRSFYFD